MLKIYVVESFNNKVQIPYLILNQCQLGSNSYMTVVDHKQFEGKALDNEVFKECLLPQRPDELNMFCGGIQQLENTCKFHYLPLGYKSVAQVQLNHLQQQKQYMVFRSVLKIYLVDYLNIKVKIDDRHSRLSSPGFTSRCM